MLGTSFVLDEEKIKREGNWKLDEIYAAIEKEAKDLTLIKKSKNYYIAQDNEDALGMLMLLWDFLLENNCFKENVKEWLLLDNEEGNKNLISHFQKELQSVYA